MIKPSESALVEFSKAAHDQADTAWLYLRLPADDAMVVCIAGEFVIGELPKYHDRGLSEKDLQLLQVTGMQKFMERYRLVSSQEAIGKA